MSDIEKRIEQWRTDLADSEVMSRADIQEMESHLREEITHLGTSGLSDDEVFLVARHRLGDPTALEREFAKLRPHRGSVHRLYWAMMGVLLYLAAAECASMMFPLALKLGYMAGLRQTAVGFLGSAVEMIGFAGVILLALWLYLRHSHHCAKEQVSSSLAAPTLGVMALVLGTWMFFIAGKLLSVLFMRTVEAQQVGAALRAEAYVRLVWYLVAPALLAGLLVVLYRHSRQEVQAT